MRSGGLVQGWMVLAGVALVVVGVLGFFSNPLVGKASGALIPTDNTHNLIHLFTGLLALYIAFRLRGQNQVSATLGFGILYVAIFLAVLISPTLFSFFEVPASGVIHLINAALAAVSLGVAYMARNSAPSYTR